MSEWKIRRPEGEALSEFDPSTLPSDADNYDVFCERCQKVHRRFTYTREDHERVMKEGAQKLADAIDQQALEHVLTELAKAEGR